MARASLPMYDFPEVRDATLAWWAGLARAFRRAGVPDVPDRLAQGEEAALWADPALLFTQTCGYPLTHRFRHVLRPVATPEYAAPGCRGADYASVVVVRAEDPAGGLADLRGRVCAINGRASHSGCNILRRTLAPLAQGGRFFAKVVESGAHARSLAAVREGVADVAAIDCVTFALLARCRPAAVAGLRILAETARAPALPYATAAGAPDEQVARLRDGVLAAVADPALARAREALLIRGAVASTLADYAIIERHEREAAELGYPELR